MLVCARKHKLKCVSCSQRLLIAALSAFMHIFTGLLGTLAMRPCLSSSPPLSSPLFSSDMLLLWTSTVLTLLCLLPSGQILHQYAGDVHPVPHHELRCFLPNALTHRL